VRTASPPRCPHALGCRTSAAGAAVCGTRFSQDPTQRAAVGHPAYGGDVLAAYDDIVLLTFNLNECA
jgi:hypothetical protein